MNDFLSASVNIGTLVVVFMIIYSLYLYLKNIIVSGKKLSVEQLELLENAARYAVGFAEQIYKTDNFVDRYQLAVNYVYDIMNKAGINTSELLMIIRGLIESEVLKLPQTHKAD